MSARETDVFLVLPWTPKRWRHPSKKAARAHAAGLIREWKTFALEVTEDSEGDLVVQEVTGA